MNINSQFDLFFYTHIWELNYRNPSLHRLDFLERVADNLLAESRYWLNIKEKHISLINRSQSTVRTIDINDYTSLVAKIYSLAKAILGFIPAVLIKASVWILEFSYIYQRNKRILELLKEQSDFKRQCNPQDYFIQPKQFSQKPKEQNQSKFNCFFKGLQLHTLSFLGDKDIVSFAHACKENYELAAHFSSKPANQCRNYPNFIIETLGKEKLSEFSLSTLPEGWQVLFNTILRKGKQWGNVSFLEQTQIELKKAEIFLNHLFIVGPTEEDLSSLMGNEAIQRIQLPEGPGLIIRVRDNMINQEHIFVIAKVEEKWIVVTSRLSPAMWLFLNDLRFHNHVPLVIDYLRRLFNGEPCGNFPYELDPQNINYQGGIEINYQQVKASDVLQEGPLLCPDGRTSRIQLCKF